MREAKYPSAHDQFIRERKFAEAMRLLNAVDKMLDDLKIKHEFKVDMQAIKG